MKYHIITYGCQMNKSDSERIARVLEGAGCQKAPKIDGADLVVVNMCSVRQSAVDRVYGLIAKFKKLKSQTSRFAPCNCGAIKYNLNLKTILTGCILKKDRKKFARQFDFILEIKDLPKWPKLLKLSENRSRKNYFKVLPKSQSTFRAFVPIMTGCNNFCTYCVVPHTRGREISRPADDILCEVENMVKRGAKEIWLLGQNVNSYGIHRGTDADPRRGADAEISFSMLLRLVNDIPGDFWIRFTSSHPKDFSDELIKAMAECKKVTPYLNLPVQSGDNEILKKMNRPYSIEHYKNLVEKIRAAFAKVRKGLEKELALSTDIIVGFPGETKEQFENTAKLFKEIKFDMAYIAQFSPRPGTLAAKMEDSVPKKEKQRREKALTEILKETAREKNKKYIGKVVKVLPEKTKGEFLIGKTGSYKTIKFEGSKNLIGNFVKAKIIDASPWGLKGKLL